MLNNTQVTDPCGNQCVKVNLTAKPKEVNNILRNENKALNSKSDNEPNTNSEKNRHLNADKSITPCPLEWCVKETRCDYEQNLLVSCSFLQKRGFCLKDFRCDFIHPKSSILRRPNPVGGGVMSKRLQV